MSRIIKTSYGSIKGVEKISCYEKPYLAFYGIPYAKQPTGEFRFKDPRPLETWETTFDASKPGDACWNFDRLNPNPTEKKIIGSDNCLHLNIYVPQIERRANTKLPVMLYIHGGRFVTMSATPFYYGPDYLMERNVILVTINYRLGAFGFLSLNDTEVGVPGNAGIKDQLMALKWVKNEIGNFGGDTENTTLFGQSAGACSVNLHLLYNKSQNLFNRAIMMSGSAFGPWSVRSKHDYEYRLAKALGYQGLPHDDKEVFKVISEADPVHIVQLQDQLMNEEEKFLGQLMAFGPVVEPYITETTFIHDYPIKIYQNSWGKDIDVIIGGCSMEGLLMYPFVSSETMSSLGNFSHIIAQNVHLDYHTQKCIEKGIKLKEFYYGSKTPSLENTDILIDIFSDKVFWHGMWMAMNTHISPNSKTFLYRFDVSPTSNQTIRELYKIPHQRGTSHVEDIFYIFKAEYLSAPDKRSFEYKIMQIFARAFAQFARNEYEDSIDLGSVVWNPIEDSNGIIRCLNLNGETKIIKFPETTRMRLWDEICENNI